MDIEWIILIKYLISDDNLSIITFKPLFINYLYLHNNYHSLLIIMEFRLSMLCSSHNQRLLIANQRLHIVNTTVYTSLESVSVHVQSPYLFHLFHLEQAKQLKIWNRQNRPCFKNWHKKVKTLTLFQVLHNFLKQVQTLFQITKGSPAWHCDISQWYISRWCWM